MHRARRHHHRRGERDESFGGLDVVVNNAGILRDRMIVTMTEQDWDAVTAAAGADLSPEAISPLVVWLGSPESREVTGRVFGIWGNAITVLEGWVNGPGVSSGIRWDPAALSAVVPSLVAKAAPNADMFGNR